MIEWGIIGCGDIANKRIAPAISQNASSKLVAVVRRDGEKARRFAEKHRARRFYTDVESLLADEQIKAVYISTPVYLHCKHTIMAAEAGKHVLCEKPMAINSQEGEKMITACQANKVKFMVAYYRRFYPMVRKIKTLLKEKILGQIVVVKTHFTTWYAPSKDDPYAWRIDPARGGGGPLMDVGSHSLDLLIYLFGMPEEVSSYIERVTFSYKVEDSVFLLARFKQKIHLLAHYNFNLPNSHSLEIYGTKGKIIVENIDGDMFFLYDEKNKCQKIRTPHAENPAFPMIESFAQSLQQEKEIAIPGKEGIKATKVIDAIYKSAKLGRSVRISR